MEWIILTFILLWLGVSLILKSIKRRENRYYGWDEENFDNKTYDNGDYGKLLNTAEWKAKREHIIERDGHECQWCHKHGTRQNPLQVHHKYYVMRKRKFVDPWDYPDSAFITLCKSCHEWAHKNRKPPIVYK